MRITKENDEFKMNYLLNLNILNMRGNRYYHFCQLIQSNTSILDFNLNVFKSLLSQTKDRSHQVSR